MASIVPVPGTLSITSNISDRVLDGSSAVTLSCSGNLSRAMKSHSSSSLVLLMTWWYHNEIVLQSDDVWLNNNSTTFTNTLTIDPFNISSVGDYKCVAKVNDSTAETTKTIRAMCKTYWLYLLFIPVLNIVLSVSLNPMEDIYTIGDTVTLTCIVFDAYNNTTANITWYYDDVQMGQQKTANISVAYKHNLTINNISLSDAGLYTCMAELLGNELSNELANNDSMASTGLVVRGKYIHVYRVLLHGELSIASETKVLTISLRKCCIYCAYFCTEYCNQDMCMSHALAIVTLILSLHIDVLNLPS